MKNDDIYQLFQEFLEEFKEYVMSNEEIWLINFEKLKQFIQNNQRRPNESGDEKKLEKWLSHQLTNYKKRIHNMKEDNIYQLFQEFLEEFKEYVMSNEETWKYNLNILKNFIRENNRRPSEKSKNKDEKKLGQWLSRQLQNHKKRTQIMKNDDIYQLFQEFLENDEFKEYFV
jgi:hypothetical protein